MRKLLVKYLSLQCVVVKGSLMSVLLLAFSPLFVALFLCEWIAKKGSGSRIASVLNKRIPLPGSSIVEEASASCDTKIRKYEHFLGLRRL